MIEGFEYEGIKFSLVSSEEMNHYLDSDKIVFLLADVLTETDIERAIKDDIEAVLDYGIWLDPSDDRREDALVFMAGDRKYFLKTQGKEVKNFYCFVED